MRVIQLKQRTLWLVCGAAFAVQGCNWNFDQDPLSKESESIRNAQTKETEVPPPPKRTAAIDPKELFIDILGNFTGYFSFFEGEEGVGLVAGRVLTPSPPDSPVTYKLSIDNLADFEGARFNEQTGQFTWRPPFNRSASEYALQRNLIVRLTAASPQGKTEISTTRVIPILVFRKERDPVIVSIENAVAPGFIREGSVSIITVKVDDPESAGLGSPAPVLQVIPSVQGAMDISRHAWVQPSSSEAPNPVRDANVPGRWIFRVMVDLSVLPDQEDRGPDYTRQSGDFQFGLKVYNRFGRFSQKTHQVKVYSNLMKPRATWADNAPDGLVEFKIGRENHFQFLVFDRRAEGTMSAFFQNRFEDIDGIGTCDMRPSNALGDITCRISARPTEAMLGTLDACPSGRNQFNGPKNCKKVMIEMRSQLALPNNEELVQRDVLTRYIKIVR